MRTRATQSASHSIGTSKMGIWSPKRQRLPMPRRKDDSTGGVNKGRQDTEDGDLLLATGEAASQLGTSRPHIFMLCDQGKLGEVKRSEGGHRRIRQSAVDRYKRSHLARAAPLGVPPPAAMSAPEQRDWRLEWQLGVGFDRTVTVTNRQVYVRLPSSHLGYRQCVVDLPLEFIRWTSLDGQKQAAAKGRLRSTRRRPPSHREVRAPWS